MNKDLLNFIAPLALLTSLIANTSLASAQTLGEALRSVHSSNAKLESERARARSDSEKIPQARAGFLPSVALSGSYGHLKDKNLVTGTHGSSDPRNMGISFSQPLFNGFRNIADYQRAHDEVLASMSNLMGAQQQTLLYGAQAYLRVLRDRKIMTLRQANLGNLRSQLSMAQTRFQAGDMTLTGVDQTKARLAEAEADVAQTRADLADSEAYYRYMIGQTPGRLANPSLNRVTLPCSLQDALLTAENENPALQTAAHLDRAAEGNVKAAKAAHMPTVSLDGSYRRGYDDSKIVGSKTDDASLGLKLSMPIFSGGLDASRIRQAQAAKEQRSLELTDSLHNTRRSVTSSFDALRATKLRKTAAIKRVAATSAALHGLNIEFQAGQIPLVNVLDGRREYANSQVTQAMTEFDDSMNVFYLLAALGQLNMPAVDAISTGRSVNASYFCGKSAPIRSSEPLMVNASAPAKMETAKIIPNRARTLEASTKPTSLPEPILTQAPLAVSDQKEGAISLLMRKAKSLSVPKEQVLVPVRTEVATPTAPAPTKNLVTIINPPKAQIARTSEKQIKTPLLQAPQTEKVEIIKNRLSLSDKLNRSTVALSTIQE